MLLFLLLFSAAADEVRNRTLYFGVLTERTFSMIEGFNSLKRAFKNVNDRDLLRTNDERILLDIIHRDTQVNIQVAMAAIMELGLLKEVIGIVGTPELHTAEATARFASLLKLPVLTTEAKSPKLVDKQDMPFFFRSQGSDSDRIRMAAALCAHFDWMRVAALTSDNDDGYAKTDLLKEELRKIGATLTASVYYAVNSITNRVVKERLEESTRALKFSGCRITIFLGNPDDRHDVVFALGSIEDDMQIVHIGDPTTEYFDGTNFIDLTQYMRGWLFVMSINDEPQLSESYPDYEGPGIQEMYYDKFVEDTIPWDCASTNVDPFGGFNETPGVYDFSFYCGYPNVKGGSISSPFPFCAPGDGLPYGVDILKSLNTGFYDAGWILALALKKVLGEKTIDDLMEDGELLKDALLETDWFGLRSHYLFNPETQDLSFSTNIANCQNQGMVDVLTATKAYDDNHNYLVGVFLNQSSVCLQSLANNSIQWPSSQLRATPLDGREVSATKCSFDKDVITLYRRLGLASVKVHLLSNFEEEFPVYGTIFDVHLVEQDDNSHIVWNGSQVVPAHQNETILQVIIPKYGEFSLIVSDHYTKKRVENLALPILATEPDCANGLVWAEDEGLCEDCPIGREARSKVCSDCNPGRYRADLSVASCLPCPETTYAPHFGNVNCTACPANSIRYENDFVTNLVREEGATLTVDEVTARVGTALEQCLCRPGFYASMTSYSTKRDAKQDGSFWGATGVACEPCPSEGGSCKGKTFPPQNDKDSWGDRYAQQPRDFQKCAPDHCGKNYRCERGFRGRKCALLKQGQYFSVGGYPPSRCFQHTSTNAIFFFFLLSFIFALWIYVNLYLGHYAITIFFTHVQFIAIVAHFDVPFPRAAHTFLSVLYNFVLFDADIVSFTCLLTWTKTSNFYFIIAIPFLGTLAFFAPVVAPLLKKCITSRDFRQKHRAIYDREQQASSSRKTSQRRRKSSKGSKSPRYCWSFFFFADFVHIARGAFHFYEGDLGQAAARATAWSLTLVHALYPNLVFNAVRMIRCDHDLTAQEHFTRIDPTLRCGSKQHVVAFYLATIIIFGCLGFPLWLSCQIRNAYFRDYGVHEDALVARLSWFYDKCRSPYHATPVVPLLQTLAYCFIATAFNDGLVQLCAAAFVSIHYFRAVVAFRPFDQGRYNALGAHADLTVLLYVTTSTIVMTKSPRFHRSWTIIVVCLVLALFAQSMGIAIHERLEAKAKNQGAKALRHVFNISKERKHSTSFDYISSVRSLVTQRLVSSSSKGAAAAPEEDNTTKDSLDVKTKVTMLTAEGDGQEEEEEED